MTSAKKTKASPEKPRKRGALRIGGIPIRLGETRHIQLKISESYFGDPIEIPVHVIRGRKSGPRVFITAALHGDEINGTGIIRELMFGRPPALARGTLILIPVVNVYGFETTDRYMADRRDINRCFPGTENGSYASRVAYTVFNEIVRKCDYGIDLHTAALYRTNFPNVRADLSKPAIRDLAKAFGCELIVNGKGPEGAFRRSACEAGCPTIILEAGEVAKMEPTVLELGVRGINNVLMHLDMISGHPIAPVYQTAIKKTSWLRAELGGLLQFHVTPGDIVHAGQPLATNVSVFGQSQSVLISPSDGIVLGMTTMPAVKPGEPVCHVATTTRSLASIQRAAKIASPNTLYHRLRDDLSRGLFVMEQDGEGM